jgi:hypothetical protein
MDSKDQKSAVKPSLEEIMLMREQREQAEYEEAQAAKREVKLQHAANISAKLLRDQRVIETENKHHKSCSHMKGRGPQSGSQAPAPKFNLYAHQLPSGEFFIKCLAGCGMRWNMDDTREWLFNRDGVEKTPNHTGQSFQDMWNKLPHDAVSRSAVQFTQPVSA